MGSAGVAQPSAGLSAGPTSFVHSDGHGWLALAISAEMARKDQVALALVACIEVCILLAGFASSTVDGWGVAVTALAVALELAVLALAAAQPLPYAARWRLPLLTVTRLINMMLYPAAVDLLSVMMGRKIPAAAVAAAAHAAPGGSTLEAIGSVVRAVAMLLVPVSGVHACMLVSLHWQLPPVAHLAVQTATVATLMWRAPTVCQQYISIHPVNAKVGAALHWLLRQAVSLVCIGTREHLTAAALAASPVEICTAVAWSLEASLGLVLSTLLLWRQQLRWAYKHTSQRMQQLHEAQQLHLGRPASWEAEREAEADLNWSAYGRVCKPVLEAAGACGSWAVPVGCAALIGFIAALLAGPSMGSV